MVARIVPKWLFPSHFAKASLKWSEKDGKEARGEGERSNWNCGFKSNEEEPEAGTKPCY